MKRLQKNLQSMTDEILKLAVKVDKMEKRISKLEKSRSKAAVKGKTGRGVKKGTATSDVLAAIGRSRKGVTTSKIKEKTGFDEKKIYNIINRLKSMEKVKSAGYGVYVKK